MAAADGDGNLRHARLFGCARHFDVGLGRGMTMGMDMRKRYDIEFRQLTLSVTSKGDNFVEISSCFVSAR